MSALNFECTICVLLQCYRLLVVFSPLLQNYHLICDTHFNTIVIDKVEICPLTIDENISLYITLISFKVKYENKCEQSFMLHSNRIKTPKHPCNARI